MRHINKIKTAKDESLIFEPEYVVPFNNDDIIWNSVEDELRINCNVSADIYNKTNIRLILKYVGQGYSATSSVSQGKTSYKLNVNFISNSGFVVKSTNSTYSELPADQLDCRQYNGQSVTWGWVIFKYGDLINFECTGNNGSSADNTMFIKCHDYTFSGYYPFDDGTSSVMQKYFNEHERYFAAYIYNSGKTFSSGTEYTIYVPLYKKDSIFFNDTEVLFYNSEWKLIQRLNGNASILNNNILQIKFKPTSTISSVQEIAFKCQLGGIS